LLLFSTDYDDVVFHLLSFYDSLAKKEQERERESILLSFRIFYAIVLVRPFNFHHHPAQIQRCGVEATALALDASGEEINAAQIEEDRNQVLC
jgi:hypothetical protein